MRTIIKAFQNMLGLRSSIRVRLTLPFLLMTLVIAGLGSLVVTRLVAGSIEERLANQLLDSAQIAANALVELEEKHLETLRLMTNTIGVDEALANFEVDRLDTFLRPLAVSQSVGRLLVFDTTAQIIYQLETNPSEEASIISEWTGVQRILALEVDEQGDKYAEVIVDGAGAYLYTVAPVRDGTGQLVGGIVVGTPMDEVVRFLSGQAVSNVTLYDQNGEILASTLPERSLTAIPVAEVNARLQETETTDQSEALELEGVTYQSLYSPLRVRSQIVGLQMVALRSDFIADRIGVSRNLFIAVFGGFFLAVLTVGIWLSRSIMVPLSQLVSTTRTLREGHRDQRVQLQIQDELGELGGSFDQMTDALVKRNEQIGDLYEQQVRETAQRDAVLGSIADAVLVLDTYGRQILRNEAATELMQSIAANQQATIRMQQFLSQPMLLAEPQVMTFGNRYYSGLARPVVAQADTIGSVLAFRDVTALIEAEEAKDEIILQISHELRTPLSAVRGYFDLLSMLNQFDPQSQGFVTSTDKHLLELEHMINQVIEVSVILSSRFELTFETMDLVELLKQLMQRQAVLFQQKNIKLTLQVPPLLMLSADGERLAQALDHILNNARQYTKPFGEVNIRLTQGDATALIEVEDTGVGIAEDEIDHVFERMFRGRAAEAGDTDTRGLGVGLFLCREIIEGHQGKVSITSSLDEGTIVRVELPIIFQDETPYEYEEYEKY